VNILITGVAGFVGSHLAERLVSLGHQVRGIDCLTDYYSRDMKRLNLEQITGVGATCLPLDLAQDDLSEALQGAEIVYHLAAQPGISAHTPFDTYLRNNIVATQRLLEAVERSSNCQGMINISTSSVYGSDASGDESTEPKPTSYYGVTKLAAEQLVLAAAREGRLAACSLRLFSVYGPRERPDKLYTKLIHCILAGQPFPLHEGSEHHVRSYTYIADIVDGLVAVLSHWDRCGGEILNIGTDVTCTTGEAIKLAEEIIGKPARLNIRPRRPGDQQRTHANIAKARRLLGYNPTTTLADGLAQEVAWYREQILGKIDLWPGQT
jgi:UDP-glucuronate 4-epimerase